MGRGLQPTTAQCETLYRVCNELTVNFMYGIDLVRIDERTANVVILYGEDGYLEIDAKGELLPEASNE